MEKILTTSRLYLRCFSSEDNSSFFALNKDSEVLRFTGDIPFADEAAAQLFLIRYDHYLRYGYGRWAVIRQSDDVFLGWCGLIYSPELDETDVGFRFFRRYWGRGYATEAASACLHFGFTQLKLDQIVGRVHPENGASVRVLEKIGMNYLEDRGEGKDRWMVYHINNSNR